MAACGGGTNAPPPQVPTPTEPTASATLSATAMASSAPTEKTPTPEPRHPIIRVGASRFGADLTKLGLDPKNLPPISKLQAKQVRGVMKLFTEALHVECRECHDEGNWKANTPRKNVARVMWNEFGRTLTLANGEPLFCDSCHQGNIHFLDRHDKKALSQWMTDNFEQGLKQKNGTEHGCEASQCHKESEYKLIKKWSVNAAVASK